MAGHGAFDTNGAPVTGTACQGKLNIMGFNYEREPERMLEDMGHRVEGTMVHLFGGVWRNGSEASEPLPRQRQRFERFTARGSTTPRRRAATSTAASIRRCTTASTTRGGYDFKNPNIERTPATTGTATPASPAPTTTNNCTVGLQRPGWHTYWLSKIPKYVGTSNGRTTTGGCT